ncbi:MAG: hypothetical protein JKY54_01860 [Flavobacteriales bacterium]|nr:hypothetical protein [Flavobacteriales bacterium]
MENKPISFGKPDIIVIPVYDGISSGLDEAFSIVELIAGSASANAIQQTMQYYPAPLIQSKIPLREAVQYKDLIEPVNQKRQNKPKNPNL